MARPTDEQLQALLDLWRIGQGYSSGEKAAAKLLLGLYNGHRFPFDLTDLRLFDDYNLRRALLVLEMDANPQAEVHVLLARALGTTESAMGARFEYRAFDLELSGAVSEGDLPARPQPLQRRAA